MIAALLLIGVAAGYGLGRIRPVRTARDWARSRVAFGAAPGRAVALALVLLLPELFVPLLWHRVRHGTYPPSAARRRASAPAQVIRPNAQEENT